VNTAYFAWSATFDIVWISDRGARHSRNLASNPSAAVSVYDSNQVWGEADRGIQLFGTAREVPGKAAPDAERLYSARFPSFRDAGVSATTFYRLRARRLKLFDELELGGGVFVTASIRAGGGVEWVRTEIYRAAEVT
jgi:uncharacterized protein YhbP (UPF0306 family)